jgi:nucleoside-triphosphatase THEP1
MWVLCEAMLGGIIHGLRLPVSGLVVGGCAVICICLLAWFMPKKGSIIKATIIVAIFKMMLSPQAPFPAYIAVFFQGALAELLFWNRRYFRLACLLFAVIALFESGLQRILMLTIIYGNGLLKVVNSFFNGLVGGKHPANYSLAIGIAYVGLHIVAGIAIGILAGSLPRRLEQWRNDTGLRLAPQQAAVISKQAKRKGRVKWLFIFIWVLILFFYLQSSLPLGEPLLPASLPLQILLRSILIVLGWIFIVGPVLKLLLHGWLAKKQNSSRREVNAILELLPATERIIRASWQQSSGYSGLKKIKTVVKKVLVNTLFVSPDIYVLSAPIRSGKTTMLLNWSAGKEDVFGILTPDINGKRVFMDVHTRETFHMEAQQGEVALNIGRFSFSKSSFSKAISIIRHSIRKDGWLIIDEIGPLEMAGQGFHDLLKEVLENRQNKLLIVVREPLTDEVIKRFELTATIIHTPADIDNVSITKK